MNRKGISCNKENGWNYNGINSLLRPHFSIEDKYKKEQITFAKICKKNFKHQKHNKSPSSFKSPLIIICLESYYNNMPTISAFAFAVNI